MRYADFPSSEASYNFPPESICFLLHQHVLDLGKFTLIQTELRRADDARNLL